MSAWTLLLASLLWVPWGGTAPEEPPPRVLVVALDAVPWSAVEGLECGDERPVFESVGEAVPMVSSFPSTTTVAFSGMLEELGAPTPPGYEARFYDREQARVRGGGLRSYEKIEFSWREFFDWKIEGVLRKGIGYARPLRFANTEIAGLSEAFEESADPVLYAYVSASDAIGHLKSPAALSEMLCELDAEIAALQREGHRFYSVVLSDHGMGGGPPLRNVRKPLRRAVRDAGFRPSRRLERENDVVFVPFGLLSSLVVFSDPGHEARVAEVLAAQPGVSVCAFPEGTQSWRATAASGSARIERSSRGDRDYWRYLPVDGDPLEYGSIAQRLDRRAGVGSADGAPGRDGWHDERSWLESTVDHRFPDALRRIGRAFELVENPASVICSVAPGYMYGPWFTDFSGRLTVGRLRWTHGALEREDTLGFFVSDHPAWSTPGVMSFDRIFEAFGEREGEAAQYRADPGH